VVHNINLGMPLSVWDQNKGNIIAAEGALMRAEEETHRVEVNLRNNLAAAFLNYRNNLLALQDYQRNILPDQVRALRGVEQRRRLFGEFVPIPPGGGMPAVFAGGPAFADLITAEQTLVSSVTSYLGILSSLWSSVVSTADFLQTDDLFQLAEPQPLPPLPEMEQLCPWPCSHPVPPHGAGAPPAVGAHVPAPLATLPPVVDGSKLPAQAGPPKGGLSGTRQGGVAGEPRGEGPAPLSRSSTDAAKKDGRAEALAGIMSLSANPTFQRGQPEKEAASGGKEGPAADTPRGRAAAVSEFEASPHPFAPSSQGTSLGQPPPLPEPPPSPWPVTLTATRSETAAPRPPADAVSPGSVPAPAATARPTLGLAPSAEPAPSRRLNLDDAPGRDDSGRGQPGIVPASAVSPSRLGPPMSAAPVVGFEPQGGGR
jgi:hypothetical protein